MRRTSRMLALAALLAGPSLAQPKFVASSLLEPLDVFPACTDTHVLKCTSGVATFQAPTGGGSGGAMSPIVMQSQRVEQVASEFPSMGFRGDHPILNYADTGTSPTAIFTVYLPNEYTGGGLTCEISFVTTGTGNAELGMAIENWGAASFNFDSDDFAATNFSTCAAAAVSGELATCTVTFTDGADMDSWSAGTPGRIKVVSDVASGTLAVDVDVTITVCYET